MNVRRAVSAAPLFRRVRAGRAGGIEHVAHDRDGLQRLAMEQGEAGPSIGATVVEPDRLENIRNVRRQLGQARRGHLTRTQESPATTDPA